MFILGVWIHKRRLPNDRQLSCLSIVLMPMQDVEYISPICDGAPERGWEVSTATVQRVCESLMAHDMCRECSRIGYTIEYSIVLTLIYTDVSAKSVVY
jgi:hypothetical protein